MKLTLFVTLGRNINNEPMDREDWMNFRRQARMILESCGVNLVQQPDESHDGGQQGTWQGEVCEQACTYVGLATLETAELLSLARMREQLAELAGLYMQDAIGFAVALGHDNLIYAKV